MIEFEISLLYKEIICILILGIEKGGFMIRIYKNVFGEDGMM